ncbi:uncharacterized protein RJT21DRAFT_111683 [Scheffersomyces amazonensis]|uniref:uncharacterized protein n=1 Tax=Scheffersomyces amazonensis TaxID=1078765 RepID=UPI00315DCF56
MSSITFNVVYNTVTKKVTVTKTNTIQQLINASLTTFKINDKKYDGKLYHNDKALDTALPIRLTSLYNNTKLVLKVTKIEAGDSQNGLEKSIDINIKLIASVAGGRGETKSFIHKVSNQVTLSQLLTSFEEKYPGEVLGQSGAQLQLSILNLNYESDQFDAVKLSSVVGSNVTSLVIRLSYGNGSEDKKRKNEEQQEIIRLQLQQQAERNRKAKEQEELEREQARKELKRQQAEDELKRQQTQEESSIQEQQSHIVDQDIDYQPVVSKSNVAKTVVEDDNGYVFNQPEVKETPLLYVPNDRTATYDNPEEDYEMTVNQAMTYQKIIQKSAIRKKPLERKRPTKYLIRVRFPDRNILQLNFINDVESLKYGQLVHKIDELLHIEYINKAYNLKLSYPPFSKIDINFSNNNLKLVDMKEFQSEQISLIWELVDGNGNGNGPYIDQGKIGEIKHSDELPEVMLENHRKELPGDISTRTNKSNETSNSNSNSNTDEKDGNSSSRKTPKWLKFK